MLIIMQIMTKKAKKCSQNKEKRAKTARFFLFLYKMHNIFNKKRTFLCNLPGCGRLSLPVSTRKPQFHTLCAQFSKCLNDSKIPQLQSARIAKDRLVPSSPWTRPSVLYAPICVVVCNCLKSLNWHFELRILLKVNILTATGIVKQIQRQLIQLSYCKV